MPSAFRIGWLLVLGVLIGVGCKSNAGPAVHEEGAPVADTGYIAPNTTGGDAAGTFNLRSDEGRGREHAEEPPASGYGGARTPPLHGGTSTEEGQAPGNADSPRSKIPTRPGRDPMEPDLSKPPAAAATTG